MANATATSNVTTSATAGKRFLYLDMAKALGILLVCIYHFCFSLGGGALTFDQGTPSVTAIVRGMIWGMNAICVPLFLMATGALSVARAKEIDPWRHTKKTLGLGGAYIIWRAITILSLKVSAGTLIEGGRKGLFSAIFFNAYPAGANVDHLWFMPVYLGISLLLPLFNMAWVKSRERAEWRRYFAFMTAFLFVVHFGVEFLKAAGTFFSPLSNFWLDEAFRLSPFVERTAPMVLYVLVGAYLHEYRDRLGKAGVPALVAAFVAFSGLHWVRWFLQSRATGAYWNIVFADFYCDPAIVAMSAIAFVLLMRGCARELPPALERFVVLVSANTLGIYYIHWILGYVVQTPLMPWFEAVLPAQRLLLNGVKGVVLMLASLAIVLVMKRVPLVKKLVRA